MHDLKPTTVMRRADLAGLLEASALDLDLPADTEPPPMLVLGICSALIALLILIVMTAH